MVLGGGPQLTDREGGGDSHSRPLLGGDHTNSVASFRSSPMLNVDSIRY